MVKESSTRERKNEQKLGPSFLTHPLFCFSIFLAIARVTGDEAGQISESLVYPESRRERGAPVNLLAEPIDRGPFLVAFRLSPCKMLFKNINEFGCISNLGRNLSLCADPAPVNRTIMVLIKRAKLAPKVVVCFTHRNSRQYETFKLTVYPRQN